MNHYPGACRKIFGKDPRYTRPHYGWARDENGKVLDRLGQDKKEDGYDTKRTATIARAWDKDAPNPVVEVMLSSGRTAEA